jgi:hypothetical protein
MVIIGLGGRLDDQRESSASDEWPSPVARIYESEAVTRMLTIQAEQALAELETALSQELLREPAAGRSAPASAASRDNLHARVERRAGPERRRMHERRQGSDRRQGPNQTHSWGT